MLASEVLRATKVLDNMVRHEPTRNGLLQNRFYGSHQSVTECFVLKVLDKTQGPAAAKAFLDNLTGKQGFQFSEGYEIDVKLENNVPLYELHYGDLTVPFSAETLAAIIQDGQDIEAKLQQPASETSLEK